MARVQITLAGPLAVDVDGSPVSLPGRRVEALLIMLAVRAGRSVPVDVLATGIWDDDPPAHVRASLQTFIARLRRTIGADAVVTESSGYSLRVPRDDIDLLAIADLLEAAARAGDPEDERNLLATALERWSEQAFADAPSEWIERVEAPAWDERRLAALERRIDLDLAAHAHADVIPELQSEVQRHPLRETLWQRLLVALGRTGRTAQALEHYEAIRSRLADELGTDPSPELQAVHRELLSGSTRPPAGPAPPAQVPQQLPAGVSGFTGRAEHLATMDALLSDDARAGPVLLGLHGPGGSGKTTLAVHWALSHQERFPDGRLFINLRGFGPGEPLEPVQAMDLILRTLGVPGGRIPADEDQRGALLRQELGRRHALLVLDNALDSVQVRPLLPGGHTTVVITSRSQLRSLATREGLRRITVEEMSSAEAVELLTQRLHLPPGDASTGPRWDPAELAELAELCGRLPVALSVAAERASRDVDRPLSRLTDQLRERAGLDALTAWADDPATSVKAVLEWSYAILKPEAARLLRFLGLHATGDIDERAAAALIGTDLATARELLDRLTDCHLLNEQRAGWYAMHDLIRSFATDLADLVDPPEERDLARSRLRRWAIRSMDNAHTAIDRPHTLIDLPPDADLHAQQFEDPGSALAWFDDHRLGLLTMARQAAREHDHETMRMLGPLVATFQSYTGGLAEELELNMLAEQSARDAADPLTEAVAASQLGRTYGRTGEYASARDCFLRARELFASLDNRAGELQAAMSLAMVLNFSGRPEDAIELFHQVIDNAEGLGMRDRVAATKNNLAYAYMRVGRLDDAVTVADQALTAHRESNRVFAEALAADTLATAHNLRGEHAQALELSRQAVRIHERLGDEVAGTVSWKTLGIAQHALGDTAAAVASWTHALYLMDRAGAPDRDEVNRSELRALIAAASDEQRHPGQADIDPAGGDVEA